MDMQASRSGTMKGKKSWALAALAVLGAVGAAVLFVGGPADAHGGRPPVPLCDPDPLWPEALRNKGVTGQVGGVGVDSQANVGVLNRPATIPDGEKAASLNPPQAEC